MRQFLSNFSKTLGRRSLFLVIFFSITLETIIFLVGLSVTSRLNQKREAEFNHQVLMFRDHLEEHLNSTFFALNSLRGLFSASVEVTEAEFLTHLNTILVSPEDTSIYSVSYAPFTPTSSSCPEIKFHSVIIQKQNGDERSLATMDQTPLNLCLHRQLQEAIQTAISQDQATVSDPYLSDNQKNFSFIAPIISPSASASATISGLLISEAHIDQFFEDVYNHQYPLGIAFSIDSGQQKLADFYFGQPNRNQPTNPFTKRSVVPVGNRSWTINATSLAEFALSPSEESQPLIVYTLGTLLASLISLLVFFLVHGRQLAHEQALRIAQELKQSEEKFKLAFDSVSDQVIITDPDGTVIYVNPAIESTTGFHPTEAIGQKAGKLWGGQMEKSYYQKMWHTIKELKQTFVGDITNRHKDGHTYIAQTKISPVIDRNGQVQFFVGIERDITKEKRLQDQLELQVKKDKAIFASIGDGLVSTDQDGKVLAINASAEAMLGWQLKQLQNKRWVDTITVVDEHHQPIPDQKRALTKALHSGKATVSNNHFYNRKDGSLFPIAATVTPVILNKKIIGAIQVFRDITREKEIDRMKTEFVSLASHQLRTPLSAIKWFTELLVKGDLGKIDPKPLEAINNINISTQRMITLVNDLLNISRLEAARLTVSPQLTDIKKIIDKLQVEITPETKEKQLKFTTSIPAKLPKIRTDPHLIDEVYSNLLSNAIKYTPAGGQVSLKIYLKGKNLITEIKDSGIGISKADQKQIYSKFFRGANSQKLNALGNGLGLYLSKNILDVLGGTISFKSLKNKGTTFTIGLPLSGSKAKKGGISFITR